MLERKSRLRLTEMVISLWQILRRKDIYILLTSGDK